MQHASGPWTPREVCHGGLPVADNDIPVRCDVMMEVRSASWDMPEAEGREWRLRYLRCANGIQLMASLAGTAHYSHCFDGTLQGGL